MLGEAIGLAMLGAASLAGHTPLRAGDRILVMRRPIYHHRQPPSERTSWKTVRSVSSSGNATLVTIDGMKQSYAGGVSVHRHFRLESGRDGSMMLWDGPPRPLKYEVLEVRR